MNLDITSLIEMFDLKKGNTQGGKKEPLKKENSVKNNNNFNSIIDRMLLDSHAGARKILG